MGYKKISSNLEKTRHELYEGYYYVIGGLIFLVCLIVWTWTQYENQQFLNAQGVNSLGQVTIKRAESHTKSVSYYVRIKFTANNPDLPLYDVEHQVDKDIYNRLHEGSVVTIRYLPAEPQYLPARRH